MHLEFYLIINSYWKLVLNWETERKFILAMQLKFYVNVDKIMYALIQFMFSAIVVKKDKVNIILNISVGVLKAFSGSILK